MMSEELKKYHQEHLLKFYDELSVNDKNNLIKQIERIDFKQIQSLYEKAKNNNKVLQDKIEPINYIDKCKLSKNKREYYEQIGDKIISNGEYAVVTMAGGQGTRLGHKGPKGTFELVPHKSLFEIFCDSLKRANEKYNVIIPWYIMTSRENNTDTISFFENNNYFGYPKEKIKFFMQGEFPMIDTNGKILLEEKGKIKEAADGNGGIFSSMIRSGVLSDIKKNGIKWLFIGSIDNAILKMVDGVLLGITIDEGKLAASKTVAKLNPAERVGVFCRRNGRPSVIEYIELPEEWANLRDNSGELYYGESNIIAHLFNTSVLEKMGEEKLPYHINIKKANYINENGDLVTPSEPNSYKFESFIFDAFAVLDDMVIMRVKREEEFAPVKNASGNDSPDTARELYLKQNK